MGKGNKENTNDSTTECPICRDASAHKANAETLAAIQELRDGHGKVLKSVSELIADLNADDSEE